MFCWEERLTVWTGIGAWVSSSCCSSLVQGLVMALIWLLPDGWNQEADEILFLSSQALQSVALTKNASSPTPFSPLLIPLPQESTHRGLRQGHNP